MTLIYNVIGPGDSNAGLNSASSLRYGIQLNGATGLLVGRDISVFKPSLMKTGAPAGNVTATVRRASDDAIVASFNEVIDSTTLGASFAPVTFSLTTPYTLQDGDRILVEYGGNTGILIEIFTTDQFNGTLTRRTRFQTAAYSEAAATDIVATIDDGVVARGSFPTGRAFGGRLMNNAFAYPTFGA